MRHIRPFSLYESDDLDSLIRDLRGVGMQDFIWDVNYKNGYKLDEEAEKDYVASWRSNSGAKVVKITGTMDYGVHRNFLAQLIITLSNEKEYKGGLSTGTAQVQNYANLRISYPSGYGPLEEKEFSIEEGYKIWKGEKLIMKEILPLIDKYPIK
tara:strand:+ start:2350 stop:2811 length:462 start_codon:yes stop_codon:yes gene_type:complete